MIKKITALLLCIYCIHGLFGQKRNMDEFASIDRIAINIPDSLTKTTQDIATYFNFKFNNDNDKVRALFAWETYNIEYDIENMFNVNINDKKEDKTSKVLKTRRGICDDYTLLFSEICSLMNIKSYIVSGYTKQNDVVSSLPHAWCIAQIDDKWYLFDPTWGAGGVKNNKFIKKLNNNYFKAQPISIIKTHMPFDYMWQLLEYPISSDDFYADQIKQNGNYFNYTDSIKKFESQTDNEQLVSSINRIESNGIKNLMTAEYLRNLKIKIENNRISQISAEFNMAVTDYNEGVKKINDFINYRNSKFSPSRSDSEIREMMNVVFVRLNNAKERLCRIESADTNVINQVSELENSINEAINIANEQNTWLMTYLKKGKLARKSMFHKVSWFGIPLN